MEEFRVSGFDESTGVLFCVMIGRKGILKFSRCCLENFIEYNLPKLIIAYE